MDTYIYRDQTFHEDKWYGILKKNGQNYVNYAEWNDENCRFNPDLHVRRIWTAGSQSVCF